MLNPLRMHVLSGLVCLLIAGCGGEGDTGSGAAAAPRDGVAVAQTRITAAPLQASEVAGGAELPPPLNARLDCAP